MNLQFKGIVLLLFLLVAPSVSLNAAEEPQEKFAEKKQQEAEQIKNEAMRVVFNNDDCMPERIMPRLSYYVSLLCNHNDKTGRIIAENADWGLIALSHEGRYCAFVSRNDLKSIKVYDSHAGKIIQSFTGPADPDWGPRIFTCFSFSFDDQFLFAGCGCGNVYTWNIVTGELIQPFNIGRPVRKFSGDGQSYLVSANGDATYFDYQGPSCAAMIDPYFFKNYYIVDFADLGHLICHNSHGLCIYDINNNRETSVIPTDPILSTYSNNIIAVSNWDIEIWDVKAKKLLWKLPQRKDFEPLRLCLGAEGNILAIAYNDRVKHKSGICTVDVKTGQIIQKISLWPEYDVQGPITSLEIIAADRYGQIAVLGKDYKVRLLNSMPDNVRQALHSLSLNQLIVLLEIVPSLARGHIIHLTPHSPAWNLVNQMPPEIRALVEPCLRPLSWAEYLRSFVFKF